MIAILNPLASYASIYGGVEGGGSYFDYSCEDNNLTCDNVTLSYGLYAGYDIYPWLSLESNLIKYNEISSRYDDFQYKANVYALDFSVIASFDITNRWSIFGRIGSSYNFIDKSIYSNVDGNKLKEIDSDQASLLVGAGVEYELTPAWNVRSEYRYIDSVGDANVGTTDLSTLFFGLTYKFGNDDKKEGLVSEWNDINLIAAKEHRFNIDENANVINKQSTNKVSDLETRKQLKNEEENQFVSVVKKQTSKIEIPNPYIVKEGDWLYKLRRKYSFDLDVIVEKNNIENPDLIYPGQVLITK